MNKHYPLYAITILWPQVKEASTRIQTYANNEAITTICENRTVCKDSNIHHTSVTQKILKQLGKINNLYIETVQNVSEPFDVPVKKCKIAHYSQSFCPAPHKPTSIVNILKANLGTLFL